MLIFNDCGARFPRGDVYAGATTAERSPSSIPTSTARTADAISCSADVLLSHDTIGGTTPGGRRIQGRGKFLTWGLPKRPSSRTVPFPAVRIRPNLHGNGVAYLGLATSSLMIEGTTISDNQFGILMADFGTNETIEDSVFSHNARIGDHLDSVKLSRVHDGVQ